MPHPRISSASVIALLALLLLSFPSGSDADPCTHMNIGNWGVVASWSGDAFYALEPHGQWWAIVAVRQETTSVCDADVNSYQYWDGGTYPDCASGFLASSQAEGDLVDFVVGDFNHNVTDTTYHHVFCYGGSDVGYVIDYCSYGHEMVVDGDWVHHDVDNWNFAWIWDVQLTGGVEYAFDLNATSTDIRMALFNSEGQPYWSSRGDGVWDTARDTLWTAPVTDWYGFVVYGDRNVVGSYDVRVGYPCGNLELTGGVPMEWPESCYFSYDQTNPSWSVVGIRSTAGVGDGEGDIWQFDTWHDQAAMPYCAETILCSSEVLGDDVTDFMVADFNHGVLKEYYPLVLWEGRGPYIISWDGDDEELVVGAPFTTRPPDPNFVAEVWDVELEAGREYLFWFEPTDYWQHMALFQGPAGSPWWTARGASVWDCPVSWQWTPTVSDVYGLVVYKDGANSQGFSIRVTTACEYDGLYEGTVTSITGRDAFFKYDAAHPVWGVVSVRPQPGDGNVDICAYEAATNGYVPDCAQTLMACSNTPGEGVDFVAANHLIYGTGEYCAEVEWQGVPGQFYATWDQGSEVIEPWWAEQRDVNEDYIAEVKTLLLEGGQEYVFYLDAWGTEMRVALFHGAPIGYAGGRADSEWDVSTTTTWIPPTTAYYGLVVYNEGGGVGSYTLAVGEPCDFTEMAEGSVYSSAENEWYRYTPNVTAWNVSAVRNEGSVGDPGLWYGLNWTSDATGIFCLQGLSIWSILPDPDVDFIVGDYHHTPMNPQYLEVIWGGTPDGFNRVTWRETSGELVVGADVVERVVDEEYIAEIWDVYLEVGTEYEFEFTPRGTELHMALFGSGGRAYWANRSEAIWEVTGDVTWTAPYSDWYGLVVCSDGGGNGDFTLGAYDTPVETSFFAALAGPTSVVLRWIVPGGGGAEGVNLYRSLSRDGAGTRVNDEPLPLLGGGGYTDPDLWPDTEYWYALRTVSHGGVEVEVPGSPVFVRTEGASVASLLGVGPNPMVGETTVYYHVPAPGTPVGLRLVNARGEVVRTLVDEASHPAGTRAVVWDGRSDDGRPVVSGVYFYELTIGDWRRTGKLAVVR
jgi:hypothetical protein